MKDVLAVPRTVARGADKELVLGTADDEFVLVARSLEDEIHPAAVAFLCDGIPAGRGGRTLRV